MVWIFIPSHGKRFESADAPAWQSFLLWWVFCSLLLMEVTAGPKGHKLRHATQGFQGMKNIAELQPPAPEKGVSPCGSNPQTGQPHRFNPQTGQPCDGLPQERLLVRQAPISRAQSPAPVMTTHEPTAEERRLAAA
jgi:hypothetical protein